MNPTAGVPSEPQPDQRPASWDDHVSVYETVFEPFSLQFAEAAITTLRLAAGHTVLDVGAGSGGAALAMAERGCKVTAIDASARMCDRIRARAAARVGVFPGAPNVMRGLPVDARVMDGQALDLPEATFDAALSVFGVILFPDAVRGLAEMRRVVRPGGRVAVVTWTEPQSYELSAELRAAVSAVRPNQPPSMLPAQLRYRERTDFADLFRAAGFDQTEIEVHAATLRALSARWLGDRIAFAPGMAAQVAGLGDDRGAVIERFVANLEGRFGCGEVSLGGKAFVGSATVR